MKQFFALFSLVFLLAGCAGGGEEMDRAMALRSKILSSAIQFDAEITADYGDEVYQFSMACETDVSGKLTFTVTSPETISGISGEISSAGASMHFEDEALSFPVLAQGQITPISAPWVLVHSLRSGYLTSCGKEGGVLRLSIDDSYADDALHLDIWLDESDMPARGEILWEGRRILSIVLKNIRFV